MTPADTMNGAALRSSLPLAYYPFYGRHGQPRPIQLQSVSPLLDGREALLTAPSASGKTEAACAPLCELLLARGSDRGYPSMLLVAPTRALVSDLYRRLERPLAELGIEAGRWTGDQKEPTAVDRRSPSGPGLPTVTLATPESLDSLLSRRPERLRRVSFLVLDELHVVDGTPRGDQLRVLVSRLRGLRDDDLQVVAASATVPHPRDVAARYLRDPVLVSERRRHTIEARIVRGSSPAVVGRTLVELCRDGRARKVLLFAGTRQAVEQYATELRPLRAFGGVVVPHHGSLSKPVRESVEERFLDAPRALCVATSTLEVGIDIGDIDLVGLLTPPPDVSSLLQRVGRSGRRGVRPRALCFARDEAQVFRYRTLLELAAEGDLADDLARFDPSVLVQQALSLLHQNPGRWISAKALRSRLDEELAARWPLERLEGLLGHVARETSWLEQTGSRYVTGDETERLWALGRLHSNIAAQREVTVEDQLTGGAIGKIAVGDESVVMRIGGRGREVVHTERGRIVVGKTVHADTPRFSPRGRPIVSRALASAMGRKLGAAPGRWLAVTTGLDQVSLFHFGGTAWGILIAEVFRRDPSRAALCRGGPYAVTVGASPPPVVPRYDRAALEAVIRDGLRETLASAVGRGPFHKALPPEESDASLFEAADLCGLTDELATAELCEPPDEIPDALWRGLR